jgi:hypothetical protein
MSTTYYSTFHPAESSGAKGSAAFAGSALNTAVIYLYRRSATALTAGDKPNASTIYTFEPPSINLTGVTNGWTSTIPAGSDPLYAVTITVASDTPTVTITTAEWATPVVLSQNGTNGAPGASATVYKIRPSLGVIKRLSTGTYSPTTITFEAYTVTGTGNPTLYAGRFIIATSTDGVTYTNTYTSSSDQSSYTYTIPASISHIRSTLYLAGGTTTLVDQEIIPVAVDGTSGVNAVSGSLTKEALSIFTYANGSPTTDSYTNANGIFRVFNGIDELTTTANVTYSIVGTPTNCTIQFNTALNTPVSGQQKGYYRVTAVSGDNASATLRAVVTSVTPNITIDKTLTISRSKGGFEIVGSLPTNPDARRFEGSTVFLTTDDKLYRFDGTNWTSAVPAADITGQIASAQIADNAITNAKIVNDAVIAAKIQNGAVEAGKIAQNAVTADKIAANSITATKVILTNRDAVDPDPGFNDPTWWGVAGVSDYLGVTGANSAQPFRFTRISSGGGLRDYFSSDVPVEQGAFYRTRLRIFISSDAAGWFGCTWHWPMQAWYTVAPYTSRADVDSNAYPVIDMANTTIPKGQWVSYVNTSQFNNTSSGQHFIEHRMRHSLTAGYVEFAWEIVRANNAELIVDGAITATKVAANAITADKIEANAVTAAKIQAGSVTANKLLVVPNNLNPDPLFRDESNWILNEANAWYFEDSTTSAVSIALGYRKYAALWSGASGANIGTGRRHIYSQAIPFNGRNQILRLRGRGWNGSNQDLWLGLEFLDSSGGYISGSYTPGLAAGVGAGDITRQVSVPNNNGMIRVMASNAAPGSTFSGSLAITDIKVDIAASAEMVVDGAITADKVAANAITAVKINANAITADKIEAGAVTAAKINVTSLSAINANVGTLTAGIIRNNPASANNYIINLNDGRQIVVSGSFMKVSGVPFGDGPGTSQFIEWYGPVKITGGQPDPSLCTAADAIYYLTNLGGAYFGGSLASGIIRNSAQTTSTISTAFINVGPFSTNGGTKTISLSYSFGSFGGSDGGTVSFSGSTSITVVLEKSTNGGSTWSTIATLTPSETVRSVETYDTGTGSEAEPVFNDAWNYGVAGSLTATDNTAAGTMLLRGRISTRSLATVSTTSPVNAVNILDNAIQNITVISTEG